MYDVMQLWRFVFGVLLRTQQELNSLTWVGIDLGRREEWNWVQPSVKTAPSNIWICLGTASGKEELWRWRKESRLKALPSSPSSTQKEVSHLTKESNFFLLDECSHVSCELVLEWFWGGRSESSWRCAQTKLVTGRAWYFVRIISDYLWFLYVRI